MSIKRRTIGSTSLEISPVGMGCWPIAGLAGTKVSQQDAIAAITAALDSGINHLDTAFGYGLNGESETLIGTAIAGRRDQVVLATKGGLRAQGGGRKEFDARPQTLRADCETSLARLATDHVELYYLHAPDPQVPVAESAGALRDLLDEGKILAAGASNCTVQQLEEFASVCPLAAVQPPFNMLQRGIQQDLVPWCLSRGVSVIVYWPLLKGLLAGKLPRDRVFDSGDSRSRYPMFQGQEWEKNQDVVDELRKMAGEAGRTVAQVVVNWTIQQPGITAALCGAKRPEQIIETVGGMGWALSQEHLRRIDQVLADRGEPVVRPPV